MVFASAASKLVFAIRMLNVFSYLYCPTEFFNKEAVYWSSDFDGEMT